MGFEIIKIDRGFKVDENAIKIGVDVEFDYYIKTNDKEICSYDNWFEDLLKAVKKIQKRAGFCFASKLNKYHGGNNE